MYSQNHLSLRLSSIEKPQVELPLIMPNRVRLRIQQNRRMVKIPRS